jgi:integrase
MLIKMANKIIAMNKLRIILRLYVEGRSKLFISKYCGLSRNTVKKYIAQFKASNLNHEQVSAMSNSHLHTLFQRDEDVPVKERLEVLQKRFVAMQKALSKPGVTLYRLWEEYIIEYPEGYKYTQFRVYYKRWRGHTNVSMRVEHKAGDKMEVDYTGKKLTVIDQQTKVKRHRTGNFDEAIIQAIQFKRDVSFDTDISSENDSPTPSAITIVEAAEIYFNFKSGYNVPSHLKRDHTSKHLVSIKKAINDFISVLVERGFNVDSMPMAQVKDVHVGYWYDFIKQHYSEGSWSSPLSKLRPWVTHMINRHHINMYNPFMEVRFPQVTRDVQALSKAEFDAICDAVRSGPHYQYFGGRTTVRKNRYRPYLVDVFKLALYTGLRNEEYLTLRWEDIMSIEGTDDHMIITNNLKVERMTQKRYKKKYVPVHEDLKQLLYQLGWKELQGSNRYIIEPFRSVSVTTLINNCAKGFTHYYNQAFPKNPNYHSLKDLRKTYLTYLAKNVDEDIVHFSSHSGMRVLDNHYLDKKLVTKGIDMKIFG